MADANRSRAATRRPAAHPAHAASAKDLAWLGWVVFAGILLFSSGLLTVVQGVVALVDDDFYQVAASSLPTGTDYTIWGWTLLVVGAIMLVSGLGVVVGYPWARVVAVVVAALNALVNLGFAAAYPVWAVVAFALDVLTVYALVVHGGAAKGLRAGRRS
jgi:hypothetical protein